MGSEMCIRDRLHSVYTAGAKRGILLVGTKTEVVYAVDVSYDQELLSAYETVLDYVYEHTFAPFYDNTIEELQHNEDIAAALRCLGSDWSDQHAFWTSYSLWRGLNVDVGDGNSFPLPPCPRL